MECGFTLVELLAVLTIISLLTTLLLPALAKTKAKGAGVSCMNNNKHLTLAWKMYTDDNNDELLFASADVLNPKTHAATWVNGVMDFDPVNSSNWDVEQDIKKSPLWAYAPSTRIWRCPADTSGVRVRGQFRPRVRSMAMSLWVGGFGGRIERERLGDVFQIYRRMSDVTDPGPAGTWLLLDQREDSVNWGNYITAMHGWPDQPEYYRFIQDLPASYHHNAGGISFMDGHAEIRRWRDARTRPRLVRNSNYWTQYGAISSPHNQDIRWLQDRATRKK